MKNCLYYNSPIGMLKIEEDEKGICGIYLTDDICETKETPLLNKAKLQLEEYFNGKRKEFELPLSMHGTEFQMKVWNELIKIPYGQTCSYGEIAEKIGNPKACRAVGMANNRNPIIIIVPCHRVIGKNGSLVGYACGLDIKTKLLQPEQKDRGM